VIAGLVLVALVLVARFTSGRGPRAGYLLIAVSVAWLFVDKTMEGPTLVSITEAHGLTAGDLAGLVGILLGVDQAWGDVIRRRPGRRPHR
jgi:hypothetical protein